MASDLPAREPDSGRRYTDHEIALVLQRAVELEERRLQSSAGRGVSRRELHEIALEVGLSPEVIDEAIGLVDAGVTTPTRSLLGPPLSYKQVRGVRGKLEEDDLQRLVRIVDDRVEAAGTVTEALGTVRWTSLQRGHKFGRTTQVALTVGDEETQIQVVERFPSGLRAVLHLLPGVWGLMIGGAVTASAGVGGPGALGIAMGSVALGVGIGRTVWRFLARQSAQEVQQIANDLASAAEGMADPV